LPGHAAGLCHILFLEVWPSRSKERIVDLASWTVGLSLIVLTIAIHTTGVVMMAFGLERRIPIRVEEHLDDPRGTIPVARHGDGTGLSRV
jgi:hypothetical protein